MLGTKVARRALFVAGASTVIAVQAMTSIPGASAASPGLGGRIRPNEVFGALVNGQNGKASPVAIQMACFGPLRPGETGHPMAGQTVTVFRPEDLPGTFGNTGPNGTEIGAFFGAPPPAPAATSGPVWFHYYVTKKIPTSEILPCSGTGNVIFVPFPMSPGKSIDVVVPVAYLGQP
jgi:hypothetical protein